LLALPVEPDDVDMKLFSEILPPSGAVIPAGTVFCVSFSVAFELCKSEINDVNKLIILYLY